jgi:general nucleoside transport system permease protein
LCIRIIAIGDDLERSLSGDATRYCVTMYDAVYNPPDEQSKSWPSARKRSVGEEVSLAYQNNGVGPGAGSGSCGLRWFRRNYIAQHPLRQEGPIPGTEPIDYAARIPTIGAALGRANYGFFIAILAAVVVYLLLWRTRRGFELRAVGLSPGAANYAGMRLGLNTVLALAIGGSLAGLGGGVEIFGVYGNMDVPWVSNLGFNGIGVALLGRNHPVGVVLGALLFGALTSGAQEMEFATDVPLQLADVLVAVILLLVTATKLVELIVGKRARALAGARMDEGLGS